MRRTSKRACERIQPMLSAYADGELNQRQAAAVRRHVGVCPSCRKVLADEQALRALIGEAAEESEPSERVHVSVMNAIRQMPRTPEQTNARRNVWLRRAGGALAGVGCFIVIAVAVITGGGANKAFDAMMPDADAPMGSAPESAGDVNAPSYDADEPSYGLNDKADALPQEPQTPMDPVVPMEPDAPEMESPSQSDGQYTYVLDRVSGEGAELDGESTVWLGDGLEISVSASTRRIKVSFADESCREGSYEIADTELIVVFDDGERVTFEYRLDSERLYLTKKEP